MISLNGSEFILVVMPFVDVLQPPLGPSVLSGVLRMNKIRMKVVYPAMTLAERLPYDLYYWFGAGVALRFGDYFFANQIFGEDEYRTQKFYSKIREIAEKGLFPKLASVPDAIHFIELIPFIQSICNDMVNEWAEKIIVNSTIKVVACSATYGQLFSSLAFLKIVKEKRPDIKTIIGGCECEGDAALEIVSKFDFIDYTVSGEGEKNLPILVKSCLQNPLSGANLPFGVFDREKARNGVLESPRMRGCDFGEIDNSDYAEAAADSILFKESATAMSIEFSRGCWKGERNHCTFCGINGDRLNFRKKPIDRILQELKKAYNNGTRFFFTTDTVLDLNYLRPVFDAFSKYANNAAFVCDTVSTIDESQIKYLADSGVLFIQVGIETLHPKHIKLLNKSNSAIGSLAYLKFAQENHIHVFWNILVCIPGDSPEEYEELSEFIPYLEHLTAPGFSNIRYDKFSEYWKNPECYGLVLKPIDCYKYLFPSDFDIDINKVSMYFKNIALGVYTPMDHPAVMKLRGLIDEWRSGSAILRALSSGIIEDTRKCAIERYYQPSRDECIILRLTRNPISIDLLANMVKMEGCLDYDFALQNLLRRRLVVLWDEHIFSLVLMSIEEERERKILKRLASAISARKYMSTRLQCQIESNKEGMR